MADLQAFYSVSLKTECIPAHCSAVQLWTRTHYNSASKVVLQHCTHFYKKKLFPISYITLPTKSIRENEWVRLGLRESECNLFFSNIEFIPGLFQATLWSLSMYQNCHATSGSTINLSWLHYRKLYSSQNTVLPVSQCRLMHVIGMYALHAAVAWKLRDCHVVLTTLPWGTMQQCHMSLCWLLHSSHKMHNARMWLRQSSHMAHVDSLTRLSNYSNTVLHFLLYTGIWNLLIFTRHGLWFHRLKQKTNLSIYFDYPVA